jgi:hypothetical protein
VVGHRAVLSLHSVCVSESPSAKLHLLRIAPPLPPTPQARLVEINQDPEFAAFLGEVGKELFFRASSGSISRRIGRLHHSPPRLRLCSLGERSHHWLEQGEHEGGFALQWNEMVRFVHAGRWNRIGARMGCDNGFGRKRLVIGDSRKADRRNQNALARRVIRFLSLPKGPNPGTGRRSQDSLQFSVFWL